MSGALNWFFLVLIGGEVAYLVVLLAGTFGEWWDRRRP